MIGAESADKTISDAYDPLYAELTRGATPTLVAASWVRLDALIRSILTPTKKLFRLKDILITNGLIREIKCS